MDWLAAICNGVIVTFLVDRKSMICVVASPVKVAEKTFFSEYMKLLENEMQIFFSLFSPNGEYPCEKTIIIKRSNNLPGVNAVGEGPAH